MRERFTFSRLVLVSFTPIWVLWQTTMLGHKGLISPLFVITLLLRVSGALLWRLMRVGLKPSQKADSLNVVNIILNMYTTSVDCHGFHLFCFQPYSFELSSLCLSAFIRSVTVIKYAYVSTPLDLSTSTIYRIQWLFLWTRQELYHEAC